MKIQIQIVLFALLSFTAYQSQGSMCREQNFYCSNGYIYDLEGERLSLIRGGQRECLKAIRGAFFCSNGYVYNTKGERLAYIRGGQSSCLKSIVGSLFCGNGYVYNIRGTRLSYINGGQSACLESLGMSQSE